jgi:hypothetical protein
VLRTGLPISVPRPLTPRVRSVPVLFAATLFLSAGLLFLVQPMVGKMVLPLLGGSPAVWNTCMVFFQAVLLLGYLYAHRLTSIRDQKRQFVIHLGVFGVGLLALGGAVAVSANRSAVPILDSLAPQGSGFPVLNVVAILAAAVGVPFFMVSTSAPLLQRWFAATGHPSAKDPYFLYAASNAGSLVSLVSYPFLTEPLLRVVEQTWVFAAGFLLLAALTALCGRAALNPLRPPSLLETTASDAPTPAPPLSRKLRWLGLAFVPSSLMLGVTTHMSTDIATIPLLWVVPLALYLVTFIVAYSRGSHRLLPLLTNLGPVATLLLVFAVTSNIALSMFLTIALHLATFFVVSLLMHTELARLRPDPTHLTNYFLWVSLGGVLGGVFNGLLAPVLFPDLYEYSVALVVGCLMIPKPPPKEGESDARAGVRVMLDVMVPFAMILLCFGLRVFESTDAAKRLCEWTGGGLNRAFAFGGLSLKVDTYTVRLFLIFAPACLVSFFFIDRPARFGLAVLAILFIHHYVSAVSKDVRTNRRSYFGVLNVRDEQTPVWTDDTLEFGDVRVLSHGTTIHGRQFVGDVPGHGNLSGEPLTYYHRTGPVGDLFRDTFARHPDARVGVVGLGTGSVAAYMKPGQSFTFYEIDPLVLKLVRDRTHFTYVSDAEARGVPVEFEMGDARLTLNRHADRRYHLILLDAFSSDAIPIHLLTVEAVRMYADRIADDGLIAFHVSNRFLKLEPVVAAVAERCGLSCRVRTDECENFSSGRPVPKRGVPPGRTSCTWIVLAKKAAQFDPRFTAGSDNPRAAVLGGASFAAEPDWQPLTRMDGVEAWTDDYANVPQVIRSPELQWVRRKLGFQTPVTD